MRDVLRGRHGDGNIPERLSRVHRRRIPERAPSSSDGYELPTNAAPSGAARGRGSSTTSRLVGRRTNALPAKRRVPTLRASFEEVFNCDEVGSCADGNVGTSNRPRERACGADRVACPWAPCSRFEPFGERIDAAGSFVSARKRRATAVVQTAAEGGQQGVATGGFRSAGRVACDPNRICQPCRAGAGCEPSVGEAGPAVSGGRYEDSAATSLSRIRAAATAAASMVRPKPATAEGTTRPEASATKGIAQSRRAEGRGVQHHASSSPAGAA